jgi:hypothetical protein
MPTLESHNGYYLWHYIPNIAAAIVFAIIFAVATGAHTWRMIQTRMWFCLPFVIGGFCTSPRSTPALRFVFH